MIAFLRKLWLFARPYKSRLALGLACGVFYAITNAVLVLVIKVVVNVVFPGAEVSSPAPHVLNVPAFLRPLWDDVSHWLAADG